MIQVNPDIFQLKREIEELKRQIYELKTGQSGGFRKRSEDLLLPANANDGDIATYNSDKGYWEAWRWKDFYNRAMYQTLYVDSVNGDDSNDGSADAPFKTIKAAIDSTASNAFVKLVLSDDKTYDINKTIYLNDREVYLNRRHNGSNKPVLNILDGVAAFASTNSPIWMAFTILNLQDIDIILGSNSTFYVGSGGFVRLAIRNSFIDGASDKTSILSSYGAWQKVELTLSNCLVYNVPSNFINMTPSLFLYYDAGGNNFYSDAGVTAVDFKDCVNGIARNLSGDIINILSNHDFNDKSFLNYYLKEDWGYNENAAYNRKEWDLPNGLKIKTGHLVVGSNNVVNVNFINPFFLQVLMTKVNLLYNGGVVDEIYSANRVTGRSYTNYIKLYNPQSSDRTIYYLVIGI